jgi:hypothetical protein
VYSLINSIGVRRGLIQEAPAFIVAMILAEVFYKFHSFTLECLAFLAIWLVVSYGAARMRALWRRPAVDA